jgi:two-component system response regulator HydG
MAAIPRELIESELFGHERGAFTGANARKIGRFEQAEGGTLFLDEIGDMPLEAQTRLLRVLQSGEFMPVGGRTPIKANLRIIAATHRDLRQLIAQGLFREDLFYRINVIHIEVPPLRARASDILLVAQHYLEHFAIHLEKKVTGIDPTAADKLLAYPWPGNVRELQNCIERAVALCRHGEISAEDLPEKVRLHKRSHLLVVSSNPSELVTMEEVERRYVLRVIEAVGGNKTLAAKILGFDRKTLYRKLELYERAG